MSAAAEQKSASFENSKNFPYLTSLQRSSLRREATSRSVPGMAFSGLFAARCPLLPLKYDQPGLLFRLPAKPQAARLGVSRRPLQSIPRWSCYVGCFANCEIDALGHRDYRGWHRPLRTALGLSTVETDTYKSPKASEGLRAFFRWRKKPKTNDQPAHIRGVVPLLIPVPSPRRTAKSQKTTAKTPRAPRWQIKSP